MIYFCLSGSTNDNFTFLKSIKNLVDKCGYKLKICYEYMNRGDRWMQVSGISGKSIHSINKRNTNLTISQ